MSNRGSQKFRASRNRHRCYSSMNYQEYEDFFGTPPKMPQPPNAKPQEDPLDIPFLALENETTQETEHSKNKSEYQMKYLIQVIPQVDSSQANSIGFQSPRNKMDFRQFGSWNEMNRDSLELASHKRQRNRPRSYSQNSPFTPKLRIIDFLNESNNKARKQIKIQ